MSGFTIIAHRGDSSSSPENTLPSFDAALSQGFPHFELDTQLTHDGCCIVLHDEVLGRTTSGSLEGQEVADCAWAQLSHLDAGSWLDPKFAHARIPSLQDVLLRYKGVAHIHLELKSQQEQLPDAVAQLLMQHGWVSANTPQQQDAAAQAAAPCTVGSAPARQHPSGETSAFEGPGSGTHQPSAHPHFQVPGITITSFHLQQLVRSLQLLPGVVHGWLVHELAEEVLQEALSAGVRQVCPRANVLTEEGVRQAVAAGLSVRAWGVKDLQLLHHVVRCGCHGATVNWPATARGELQAAGEGHGGGAPR